MYFNGFPDGRIAYLGLSEALGRFLDSVWSNPDWKFSPPQTLEDVESLLKLRMSVICTLFSMSDYPVPVIGGPVQTHIIKS
jgi:hypothetical protein